MGSRDAQTNNQSNKQRNKHVYMYGCVSSVEISNHLSSERRAPVCWGHIWSSHRFATEYTRYLDVYVCKYTYIHIYIYTMNVHMCVFIQFMHSELSTGNEPFKCPYQGTSTWSGNAFRNVQSRQHLNLQHEAQQSFPCIVLQHLVLTIPRAARSWFLVTTTSLNFPCLKT